MRIDWDDLFAHTRRAARGEAGRVKPDVSGWGSGCIPSSRDASKPELGFQRVQQFTCGGVTGLTVDEV